MRHLPIAACVIALGSSVSSSVAAQKQTPPAPGQPKDFRVPARRTFTLGNGMRVSLARFGTIPKVFVRLAVRGGHQVEKADQVALTDLMSDMMQEGTTTRTAEQLSRDVASMGGALSVFAGPDRTNLTGDVLSERAPDFVAILAEVARHPRFPQSDFARVKSTRLRNLSIARSQPQTLAAERFASMVYGDHPYGRINPTEAMLGGYTLEQVKKLWAENFGAARAELYVTGVFDEASVEAAIRKSFGDWERGPAPVNVPLPAEQASKEVALIDRPGAVQSTIITGVRTPGLGDKDYIPIVVTDALLGGTFGSRITANIREQKGYTYSPFSFITSQQRGSYWAEQADVTTNVTGPSLTEIFGEIGRLQKEAPPANELRAAQSTLAGVFTLQNSSRSGITGQLAAVDLYNLADDYLSSYVRNIFAVTPEQVRDMTARYLSRDRMHLVIVGDKKVVESQLAPFGKIVP
jgi:predicted Zn-dependent peptidase